MTPEHPIKRGSALLLAHNFPPVTGGASRRFWEIYRRQEPGTLQVATTWAAESSRSPEHDLPDVHRLSPEASAREFSGAIPLSPFGDALRSLRTLVRAEGIERILCGRTLPEGWLARALLTLDGIPYDCFVHGEEVNTETNGEGEGFLLSRRHRYMSKLVFARASRLIASSENTAGLMRDQWAVEASRLRVLLPGVDTRFFSPAARDRTTEPTVDWGERRVVLAASRLQRRKGQDVLIRAIDIARASIPDILLAIIGGGEEGPRLRQLVNQLGLREHVSFLGELRESELRSCYQQCDVFVLANRQVGCDIEGFGMVLLEAQSCGRPVIAGDSGGTREALIDGSTGLVVDCNRPDALAACLVDLLSDGERRSAMGQAARRLMVERFDWDTVLADASCLFETPRQS